MSQIDAPPVVSGVQPMQTHEGFLRLVEQRFPVLRAEMDDGVIEGLLHPQMGRLAQFTQSAIDAGDFESATTSFRLVEQLMVNPHPDLLNALNVSYFEMLAFEGPNGRRGWDLFPAPLQKAWNDMQDYLADLGKKAEAHKDRQK